MNFRQLRIIRETVRSNFNLTEVANRLLTARSGVSKHVKDLEEEIGAEMFIRRGKRLLGLTDAGKEALQIIERMLIDAQNLTQISSGLTDKDRGCLRIVTTHTQARYTLPPIIARFKELFPNVRLAISQASPRDIAAVLLEGDTDVGISTSAMEQVAGLVSFPYLTWRHAAIVPKGHPLERVPRPTLVDIAKWPLVTYDEELTGREKIDEAFAAAGVEPDIVVSALDADVIKSCVEQGFGIGIIAEMAFDPERDRRLRLIPVPNLFAASTSSIAVRRGRHLRHYVYRFMELCSPALTEAVVRESI